MRAETSAQFHSEVYAYGDAWPGAQLELAGLVQDEATLRAEIARRAIEQMADSPWSRLDSC